MGRLQGHGRVRGIGARVHQYHVLLAGIRGVRQPAVAFAVLIPAVDGVDGPVAVRLTVQGPVGPDIAEADGAFVINVIACGARMVVVQLNRTGNYSPFPFIVNAAAKFLCRIIHDHCVCRQRKHTRIIDSGAIDRLGVVCNCQDNTIFKGAGAVILQSIPNISLQLNLCAGSEVSCAVYRLKSQRAASKSSAVFIGSQL